VSVLSVCFVCDVGVLWPNGWMDQDETWHDGRLVGLGVGHIVRWEPSSLLQGEAQAPIFGPCPLWPNGQTAGWIKMPLAMEIDLGPGDIVLDGKPTPTPKERGTATPQFSAHGYCGQTAGRLKVSKNVSVSALQGLGLVSWQTSNVSVSYRSRGIAGRSWSRSCLGPKTECLDLVSVS